MNDPSTHKDLVDSKVRLQIHIKLQSVQSGIISRQGISLTDGGTNKAFCQFQSQNLHINQVKVHAIWILMIPPNTELTE